MLDELEMRKGKRRGRAGRREDGDEPKGNEGNREKCPTQVRWRREIEDARFETNKVETPRVASQSSRSSSLSLSLSSSLILSIQHLTSSPSIFSHPSSRFATTEGSKMIA